MTKPTKALVEEEDGARSSFPSPTAATEEWRTHPWSFPPRAESAISFGGLVAEKKSNLWYTFEMANDEEPVEKALMASSSVAITSEDSVNSNLVTLMMDSGASGHYFDDAIIRDLKYRLQYCVDLFMPRKILTAGGALLNGMSEGVLQGLVTDNNGNKTLVWVDIVVMPGIGCNFFSVMTAAQTSIPTIVDYENPRLEGFNATVLLRSESGDLYSFVLDLSANRYGAKELAMNAVPNAQVWQRRLGPHHAQSRDVLRKRDGTGITFEGAVSDCDVCAVRKARQLVHPKTANNKVNWPFQLSYGDLMGAFTLVAIGGYKYVSKQTRASKRVDRTLCAMVRSMLAYTGFPSSMGGELFMAAVYFKNRTSHNAFKTETPFKMLHGEEADPSHIRVIGARHFLHIKDSRKVDAAAWEGKVCDYSEERRSYRVWSPKTHSVVESRNVTFIDTPPHLLPTSSKLSSLQDLVPPLWDIDDDSLDSDYISYDDLLRDIRDYTGVLDFTANILANHENAGGVSTDLIKGNLLTPATPSPGAASPAEPLSWGVSPPSGGGASPETEGLSPAPMPVTAKNGAAMRNNRIHRPNLVTRRASVEPAGAVTRYRRVRPQQQQH